MPNYRTHLTFNTLVGIPLIYAGLYRQSMIRPDWIAAGGIAFAIATVFLSPDLDLAQSRVTQNWRRLKFIWAGYHRLFSHRGWSHSVLLASVSRLAYLGMVIALGYAVFSFAMNLLHSHEAGRSIAQAGTFLSAASSRGLGLLWKYRLYCVAVFLGAMVADLLHIGLDRLWSMTLILIGRRRS